MPSGAQTRLHRSCCISSSCLMCWSGFLFLLGSRRFWNRFTALKSCGWITTLSSLYQGWEQEKRVFSMAPCYSQWIPHVAPQQCLGKLRQLRYLDLAKNRIETLDTDISGCEALEDLLLSSNMLQHLPDSIGTRKRGVGRILQLIVWTVDGC